MTPQDILSNYYRLLENNSLSKSQSAEIYYNIIYTKKAESINDLYLDIKLFLKNYIQSTEDKNYGYDNLDSNKIILAINFLDVAQQIRMYEYLKKILLRFQFENLWNEFEKAYCLSRISYVKTTYALYNPIYWLKVIYLKSFYSYTYLIAFLLIFILLQVIILLPNPFNIWPSVFEVKYENMSDDFYTNHTMNIVLNAFDLNSDFKVMPRNIYAMILLVVGKIFSVMFILKYVIEKIINRFNVNG